VNTEVNNDCIQSVTAVVLVLRKLA